MLVLETTSAASVTTNSSTSSSNMASQYIQPDYLSPLSSTLDSKRSPLALLAQTCSQIGADPTPTPPPSSAATSVAITAITTSSSVNHQHKPSVDGNKKGAKDHDNNNKSSSSKTPPAKQHHPIYEFQQPSSLARREESSGGGGSIKGDQDHGKDQHGKGFKSPGVSIKSGGSPTSTTTTTGITTSSSSAVPASSTQQQLPSEAIPLRPFDPSALNAYRPSPMFPGLYNPYDALGAFRHPAYSHLAAAYPPVSLGLSLAGYQQALQSVQSSYGRLAAASAAAAAGGKGDLSGGICRDPYCTGCPASSAAGPMAAPPVSSASASSTSPTGSAPCPAGCTQCDHQKTSMSLSMSSTSSTTTATSTASPAAISSRPYVCNWIAADNYCGKRFTSSEELLQHLRTHTSLAVPSDLPPSSTMGAGNGSAAAYGASPAGLPHSHLLAASASALHHRSAYPTPPLSPLSMAARYHPYSKPPTSSPLSSSVASAVPPPPPPPNPLAALSLHHSHPYAAAAAAAAAAGHHPMGLSAYYSHPAYSLYSQRMLAGAGVLP